MQEYLPTRRRVGIADVWNSRSVTSVLAVRDLKIKYKQSILGPSWLVIQPLGLLVAFTVVFAGVTNVHTGGVPYQLFALAGLAVWTFVQTSMTAGTTALLQNRELIRRAACPRVAFANASVVSSLPPPVIVVVATLVALVVTGEGIGWQVIILPVMAAWLVVFAWGIVLILGSITARFRDVVAVLPFLIQAGVFLSPVGYPISDAPHSLELILSLNPVSGLIEGFRWCLIGMDPSVAALVAAAVWTVAIAGTGWSLFGRMEVRFADYI